MDAETGGHAVDADLFSYEHGRSCLVDSTPAATDIPTYGTGDAIIVEAEPGRAFLAGAAPTPRKPTPRKDWEPPVRKDRDRGRAVVAEYLSETIEHAAPAKAQKFNGVREPIQHDHMALIPKRKLRTGPATVIERPGRSQYTPEQRRGLKSLYNANLWRKKHGHPVIKATVDAAGVRHLLEPDTLVPRQRVSDRTPEQVKTERTYHADYYRSKNPEARPYKPRAARRSPEEMAKIKADKEARRTKRKTLTPAEAAAARTEYHRQHHIDIYVRDLFTARAEALGMTVNAEALAVIRPRLEFLQKTNLAKAPSVEVLAFFEALGAVFE